MQVQVRSHYENSRVPWNDGVGYHGDEWRLVEVFTLTVSALKGEELPIEVINAVHAANTRIVKHWFRDDSEEPIGMVAKRTNSEITLQFSNLHASSSVTAALDAKLAELECDIVRP